MDDKILEKFRGKTVLVTGADGFMGSHLTETLVDAGADVHVFIRATSSGEMKNIAHLLRKVRVHRGDLADPTSVRRTIRKLKDSSNDKPYIFHLGAQAHVGESWERPYETLMVNTIGTLNILQAIVDIDLDIEKLDFAGTSEEFGNMVDEMKDLYKFRSDGIVIFNEKSPLNPESPYAVSKVAGDFLCKDFHRAYGVPTIVTRMFNNYGPRQNPRYVTGTIITQALTKDEIVLGALKPTRDFTYVLDGVRGHLYATAKGNSGHTYSYGYGQDISIGDWAKDIINIGKELGYWGEKSIVAVKSRMRPGKTDLMKLGVDYTKMKKETKWHPKYDRQYGISETIKYYAQNKDRWWGRIDW
ncbi:MAG: GDP-mannose 4,6-dehydratase [Candidatus Altiarchaeota archaeon]|nr:GDP-mannose 4,6-dehydratase [Candidatus Altiarchaeota archaeon]